LFSRFDYEIRRPIDFELKVNDFNQEVGVRQWVAATESIHDFRWSSEEQVEKADEMSLIRANATPEEVAYLIWYLSKTPHTAYSLDTDPPPPPFPPDRPARFYTERKRMIIDRIRKRIGILSPSE
jgi:hypothetical protein